MGRWGEKRKARRKGGRVRMEPAPVCFPVDCSGFLQGNTVPSDRKGLGPLRNGIEGRAHVLDVPGLANSLGSGYCTTDYHINVFYVVVGDGSVRTHTDGRSDLCVDFLTFCSLLPDVFYNLVACFS